MSIWVPIIISAIALIPGMYAAYNSWSSRSADKNNVVFQNAMSLIEANKKQAQENEQQANNFKKQLIVANRTISELTVKLNNANRKADKLADDLAEANTELIHLRAQIESMSKQVDGENHGRD